MVSLYVCITWKPSSHHLLQQNLLPQTWGVGPLADADPALTALLPQTTTMKVTYGLRPVWAANGLRPANGLGQAKCLWPGGQMCTSAIAASVIGFPIGRKDT